MKKYYLLYPEVAGHFGDDTVMDYSVVPADVVKLEYEFDGWMGDDLLETTPCFLCSENLYEKLQSSDLTGFFFESCKISKSELFNDLHPELELPMFYWMRINGSEQDDFRTRSNRSLLVSEKALALLNTFHLAYCEVEELRTID